jgi:tetratricopeptide (TPR) repeat protein
VGSRYGEALAQLGLAVTAAAQGELARAEPIYDRLSLGFRLFAPRHNQSFFRYWRGTLQLAQGALPQARASLGEAVELSERFGERLQAERAWLGLAQVALLEGNPEESAALARKALAGSVELALPDDRALAGASLARALLAQRRVEEAAAALDEAAAAGAATESVFVRWALARARGEALLAAGDAAGALKAVASAADDARERGYVGESLELRLVRAAALPAPARRRELAAVEAEARRLGFASIASRAR